MSRSARLPLCAVCVGAVLMACEPASTSVQLDQLSVQYTDSQYTVGEVIQLAVSATALDSDTSLGLVEVYRSDDAEVTFADAHLGTYPIEDVSTGSATAGVVAIATGGWPPGDYVLGVCEERANTLPSDSCETVAVSVAASATLTGVVPGALLVDRTVISADADGAMVIAVGQTLEFDDSASDAYSVSVYLSESIAHDDSTVQVGFYTVAAGTTPWRVDLSAATWNANVDLYLSACWANGGLANNLTDCYQLAQPVTVVR